MSLTGSHKNQLQIRCTERSQACLPALSLSLSLSPLHALSTTRHSVPNFRNPHTTAASPLSHHRSSALQTLTPPLIFCPSLPCLHCVRSLPHLGTPETHKEESQTPNSEHNPVTNIVSLLSGWMASHVGVELKQHRLSLRNLLGLRLRLLWQKKKKKKEMETRVMIADLLHRERVAKRSAEKVRVSLRMANVRARKYQIALLMPWLAFVVLFIFSLGNRKVGLRQMSTMILNLD
ncbi:hypothetical protein ACB092_05G263800 [Castanea dentata]